MLQRKRWRPVVWLIALAFGISGCGPAMQADQDRAKSELAKPAVATVLGVRQEAPPAPTAKAPPRPPMTTPASYYEPVGPFFFYVETLTSTGPSKYGFTPTAPCVQSGVFKRGMRMVVRFEVLDIKTGKRVTDKDDATLNWSCRMAKRFRTLGDSWRRRGDA